MSFKRILKRNTVVSPTKSADEDGDSFDFTEKAMPSNSLATATTVQGKNATFGTNAVIKTLYQHHKKEWVETRPKQTSKKAIKDYDRVAVKVYKIVDKEQPVINGRPALKTESVEIQSPLLVAALKDIFEPLGTFLEAHEPAKLKTPFKPLYFGYDKIMNLYDRTYNDTVLKEHLHLLTELMNDLFGSTMTRLRHLRESNLICYELAWTYFPKGSSIYCGAEDCERLYRVLDTKYDSDRKYLEISCQEIAFNGIKFQWRPATLEIRAFDGNVPITSLCNYPLAFHKNMDLLKSRLTARGKVALDYQELKYREYSGTGKSDDPKIKGHNVFGRILIDYHGYEKYHKGLQRQSGKSDENASSYIEPLSKQVQEKNKAAMLAKHQELIYMSPMLSGFSLKDKVWLRFYVDDIQPVLWNDEAYDHLVYPEEQKDLVLTFVRNHQLMKTGIKDVIVGKGQGLVTLLSGPPGTGKTLLAEAVADRTRRPLYYLQAEELGTNATQLGENIKKVFEMATEWNAVILLDEADVFMAERSPSDVLRNELVSIFLRELEYFQGIIFLTTNLLATIDNAFRSRVNIHLLFSPLSIPSRVKLCQKLLSRLPHSSSSPGDPTILLSNGDIEKLASWELNGREIKNAIKTARTWCICKGYQISLERLESAITVTSPQAKKAGEYQDSQKDQTPFSAMAKM